MYIRLRYHRERCWKISLGFSRALWRWIVEDDGWIVVLFGVRLHWKRIYGARTGKSGLELTVLRG